MVDHETHSIVVGLPDSMIGDPTDFPFLSIQPSVLAWTIIRTRHCHILRRDLDFNAPRAVRTAYRQCNMAESSRQAAMDQTVHALDCKHSSTTCHIRRLRIASFHDSGDSWSLQKNCSNWRLWLLGPSTQIDFTDCPPRLTDDHRL